MESYSISRYGHVIMRSKKVAVWDTVATIMPSASGGAGSAPPHTHSSQQGVRRWEKG